VWNLRLGRLVAGPNMLGVGFRPQPGLGSEHCGGTNGTSQEFDWRRTASAVSESRTSSLLISRLMLVWMIPSHAITFAAMRIVVR